MSEELIRQSQATGELTIEQMAGNMAKLRQLMTSVMVKDEDYGTIAGVNDKRPTLLQPGAEKLAMMFRYGPEYKIERVDLPGGHREFYVTCRLVHIPTGAFVGEATATCSTMEVKYRYRGAAAESTGRQVPSNYWDIRKKNPQEAQKLIGGSDFVTKKIDGVWMICKKTGERIENPDIAETYNTVCQIAQKRSFLRAIRQATGASNLFTQDLDEMAPAGDDDATHSHPPAETKTESPKSEPQKPQLSKQFEALRDSLYRMGVPQGNHEHANAIIAYAKEGKTMQDCVKDPAVADAVLDELISKNAVGTTTEEIYLEALKKANLEIPDWLKAKLQPAN